MAQIASVDPFRCVMWKFHDRLDEAVNEDTCRAEIKSFMDHGQLIPALGRRVRDRDYDIELIYGARRLFVARHLNRPLIVEIRDLTDAEAIIAMDAENRQRKDLSAYEIGRAYAAWIEAGCFPSQQDLARTLGLSQPTLSRLLTVGRLPIDIANAFERLADLTTKWGVNIATLMEDRQQCQRIVETSRHLASLPVRPAARVIYRTLLRSGGSRAERSRNDKTVRGPDGRVLFQVQQLQNSVALILRTGEIAAAVLRDIERDVARILESAELAEERFADKTPYAAERESRANASHKAV